MAGVSEDRLRATVESLAAWGTRWTFASHIGQVTAAIRDAFVAVGYPPSEVRFQPFSMPGSASQQNVLCGPTAGDDGGVVLLCAHYDSISPTPSAAAPGSDDNASGIAAMLETAQVLRNAGLDRQILCAAFGGEEQGLFGSRACADVAAAEGWDIRVVLNLDMVGHLDPARPDLVTVEFDQGNARPDNDAAARGFGTTMAQAAADYTSLQVEHTDIWNSEDSGISVAYHSGAARARRTLEPLVRRLGDALTVEEVGSGDVQDTVAAVRSQPADVSSQWWGIAIPSDRSSRGWGAGPSAR